MSPTDDLIRLSAASFWKAVPFLCVLILAAALASCGGATEAAPEPQWAESQAQDAYEGKVRESLGMDTPSSRLAQLMPGPSGAAGAAGPAGASGFSADQSMPQAAREVVVEKEMAKAVPMEVPVEVVKEVEVVREVEAPAQTITESRETSATSSDSGGPGAASKIQPSVAAQDRIIVHTGHVALVVDDVAAAVDQISALAVSRGGWVVGSDRSSRHSGAISVRVPAESLQQVLDELEELAIEVESLALTSQDVTDEFVDTSSRLASLRVTEQVHLEMLSKAQDVEEALMVQDRLSDIRMRIEEMQGRINYLSQVAAFSLVNVNLKLSTVAMPVDAGDDTAFRVGQPARFKANFTPPEGIDEFTYTWDFGDGNTATGRQTAPVVGAPRKRVTASVSHVYEVEGDYIAEIKILGQGDAGLAEGSDTVIVTITEVPAIEVFAGENLVAEEGDDVNMRATFTRPAELWDYEYRWDFGDGTPTEIGVPEEGATRVGTVHSFSDYRPDPYEVTFTMSAMSEAGKVSTTASFYIFVNESRGFIIGGWSAGETGKTAVRALSVALQVLGTIVIWLAVFSPIWLLIAAAVFGIIYLLRRLRGRNAQSGRLAEYEDQSGQADADTGALAGQSPEAPDAESLEPDTVNGEPPDVRHGQ